MAYDLVVVAEISRDDVTAAANTALVGLDGVGVGNGITFANDGRMFIEVENGATQTIATVVTQCTVDGQAVADPTYTVPLNEDHIFGPFPPSIYNTALGRVEVHFSNINDGTVSVWRLS
jgi:hypothetical protein